MNDIYLEYRGDEPIFCLFCGCKLVTSDFDDNPRCEHLRLILVEQEIHFMSDDMEALLFEKNLLDKREDYPFKCPNELLQQIFKFSEESYFNSLLLTEEIGNDLGKIILAE